MADAMSKTHFETALKYVTFVLESMTEKDGRDDDVLLNYFQDKGAYGSCNLEKLKSNKRTKLFNTK